MSPEELLRRLERDPAALIRVPVATYRLQLGPEFTFADADQIVSYLAGLGISDCHLSPFLQPCSDRSHGYDVADHGQHRAFRNVFTGEIVETVERDGRRILPLAAAFSVVPVAMLERLEGA